MNQNPTINALHLESQQVAQAIANLDAGGRVGSMTIMPPAPTPPPPGTPTMMMMAVNVTVPGPNDPVLLADVRAWLVQRQSDIAAELTTLGVTVPPPARTPVARGEAA